MTVISLHPLDDRSSIQDLKSAYLKSLTSPMDGMWDAGFTDPAPHWEIRFKGDLAGYYAANDEGALLQFYVAPTFERHGQAIFDAVVAQDSLTHAVVSTIDPGFLSFCLDLKNDITVHTYLYEVRDEVLPNHPDEDSVSLRLIEISELDRTVALQQACIGGDTDLSGWLYGYSTTLINRGELFVLCQGSEWLGLGERRRSDSQEGIADLGMMIAPAHRGKGWATYLLSWLARDCATEGLHAICSTTIENTGAQKAILSSGFISRHRIMNVGL